MKFQDFLKALQDAGWDATADAQHTRIFAMWEKLFPVIAELEEDVSDLERAEPIFLRL